MIVSLENELYFYTHYSEEKHRNDIEIDFLLSNKSKTNLKLYPIEVKSGKNYSTSSFDEFNKRFPQRIDKSYIVHPKQFSVDSKIIKMPPYLIPFVFGLNRQKNSTDDISSSVFLFMTF